MTRAECARAAGLRVNKLKPPAESEPGTTTRTHGNGRA